MYKLIMLSENHYMKRISNNIVDFTQTMKVSEVDNLSH